MSRGTAWVNPLDRQLRLCLGGEPCREKLAAYQLGRINETLALVQTRSRFYQDLYGYPGPWRQLPQDASGNLRLRCLEDVACLPFIDEGDLKSRGKEMLCSRQDDIQRIVTLQTSGTTEQPKRVYFSRDDLLHTQDYFFYGLQIMAHTSERAMILFPCRRPDSVGDLLLQAFGRLNVPAEEGPWEGKLADAAAKICARQPRLLIGAPIPILAIGRYMAAKAIAVPPLSAMLISSDYAAPGVVKALGELWGCPVYQHYGLTESAYGAAVSCIAEEGQHIRETDLLLEIVDPESGRALEGEREGEIVLTTFTRQAMPLIRYRSGDRGHCLARPCSCGSILRRLADGPQRRQDFISTGQGHLRLGMLDDILLPLAELGDIGFRPIDGKSAVLCLWAVREVREELVREVLGDIPALGDLSITLDIQPMVDLPPLRKRRIAHLERSSNNADN